MKTIKQIKDKFNEVSFNDIEDLIKTHENDERIGVKKIIKTYKNKLTSYENEQKRLIYITEYERYYNSHGYIHIAGIDEVGRGPLAGPVVSSAVILPEGTIIQGIDDSKKLSKSKRQELFLEIKKIAIYIGIGIVEPEMIDEINILNATKLSMKRAIENLKIKPEYLFIDAISLPDVDIPALSIIKGDEKSISIAAASIIAKETRDSIMDNYHNTYPQYNFLSNKGYGSKFHLESIKKYGHCKIHRKSFIKGIL